MCCCTAGAERSGMGLHHAAAGFAFYPPPGDLPGYGRSGGFGAMSLEAMAQRVLEQAPPQAVWLGWSLGGLVASQAIMRPERVQALVTVASSPVSRLVTTGPASSPRCWPDFSSS